MLNAVPIKVSVISNPRVKHINMVHGPIVFCIRHVLLKNNISTIIIAIIVNNIPIIYVAVVSSHKPLLPGTSLEPSSPTAQASSSDSSTFRIVCDVPRIALFCTESTECFPGMASKFSLKPVFGSNYYCYYLTFQVPNSLYLYTQTLVS